MLLCKYCIEELKSRGEAVYISDMVLTAEEAEEENTPCEWCNEHDDLYEVR